MNQIKLVLFDVGNVVVRAKHKITEAILWDLGVRPDKAALFFHNSAYGEFARGLIHQWEFIAAVREALEAPWMSERQVLDAHNAHIWSVDIDVVTVLHELRRKNVSLAFATTTNEWQTMREREIINLTEYALAERIFRSHEMGMAKTDPKCFPEILRRLVIAPEQSDTVLFVDDARANCEAALRVGLQTHLYDPTPVVGVKKLREDLQCRGLLA